MRAIWSGSISFGLLQVPVQLVAATREIGAHFRLIDSRDQHAVRYERVNAKTGVAVPWKEVKKAYEVHKGEFVVVDEETLKKNAPEQTQTIELEAFVERRAVEPIWFEKPYYVLPGKKAQKGYAVLRQALAAADKLGIARVVLRTRQYLAALHAEGEALVLTLMRFGEELVPVTQAGVAEAVGHPKVRAEEMTMAKKLLESMTRPWHPSDYKDEFRPRLRELLDQRAEREGVSETPAEKEPQRGGGEVLDLMATLKRSLASAQGSGNKARARRAPRRANRARRAS